MKRVLSLASAAVLMIALASCNECVDCECPPTVNYADKGSSFELCKNDFENKKAWEDERKTAEGFDCVCE